MRSMKIPSKSLRQPYLRVQASLQLLDEADHVFCFFDVYPLVTLRLLWQNTTIT